MRIISLLALALFFSPIIVLLPFMSSAAEAALVNINTAGSAELETLSGIGPTKAAAIIEYRTANGPFAKIEDIQNVSGIGPATYAAIEAFITVGDAPPPEDTDGDDTDSPDTASTTTTTTAESDATGGGGATSATSLTLNAGPDRTASTLVPLRLSAQVSIKGKPAYARSNIRWNFGDGSLARGTEVEKTYEHSGSYLVMVDATNGPAEGHDELLVTVVPAQARILSLSPSGVTVVNESSYRIDLSGWWIRAGEGSFRVPRNTVLLPKAKVLFSTAVTSLPISEAATLAFPDGQLAHSYLPTPPLAPEEAIAALQPAPALSSSHTVQTISYQNPASSLTSTQIKTQAHGDEAASAPAVAPQIAAAGAASAPELLSAAETDASATAFLQSPWTLAGLVSILLLAGGAFIFL